MKLWQKYLLGITTVTSVAGAPMAGMYAYSKTDLAKGEKHVAFDPLGLSLHDLANIEKYDISFRNPKDTKKIVGKFKFNANTKDKKKLLEDCTVDGAPVGEWVENYYKTHRESPVMFIYAGTGIKFSNFYTESIFPVDFIRFVSWFAKNVPWTPGIASISSYIIKKGIEEDAGRVTLGSYSSSNGEKKEIKFIPDSYYNVLLFSSYIQKINQSPLTKTKLISLIKKISEFNKKQTDKTKKIYPYSNEKNREGNYDLYVSKAGLPLLKGLRKLYSSESKVSDITINVEDSGELTILNKVSKKVPFSSKISRLAALRAFASKSKWKGIGLNFLKEVSIHEYGHLQTLSLSTDAVNKPVALGVSSKVRPNAGQAKNSVNIDVLNRYLQARIPFIRAVRVSPRLYLDPKTNKYIYRTYESAVAEAKAQKKPLPSKDGFMNVAFEINRDPSNPNSKFNLMNLDKIFPGNNDPSDPNNMLRNHSDRDAEFAEERNKIVEEMRQMILSKKNKFQFFMRDFKDVQKFAKFLGVPAAAVMFMNANDNYLPTVSPDFNSGYSSVPYGKYINIETKKWSLDSAFKIKAKDGVTPWFLDSKPDVSWLVNGIDIEELKIFSTKKELYINPLAAFANGIHDSSPDEVAKYLLGEEIDGFGGFKSWFYDNLEFNETFEINGNDSMHESFKPSEMISLPEEKLFSNINIEGTYNPEDIGKLWKSLNDINYNDEALFKHAKNIIYYKNSAGKKTPFTSVSAKIIDKFSIKNSGSWLSIFSFIYAARGYSDNFAAPPILAVLNDKRVISTNTYKISKTSPNFSSSGTQDLYKKMGEGVLPNQSLFSIFKGSETSKPLLLFSNKNEQIKSLLSLTNNNLEELKAEIKRIDPNSSVDNLNLVSARAYIANRLINKATSIKFNNQFQNKNINSKWKFNLSGIDFKIFDIDKIFDLMYLDIDHAEAKSGFDLGTSKNRNYLSISDDKLDDYINNSSSLTNEQKKYFKTSIFSNFFSGLKDFQLTEQKFTKLCTLFNQMGDNPFEIPFIKNLLGKFSDKVTKDGTLSLALLKKEYNNLQNMDKSVLKTENKKINTLAALHFLISDKIRMLNGTVQSFGDFSKIYFQTSLIEKWINNPWEGFQDKLKSIFSNYTSTFSEVITRDLLQMTYVPNFDEKDVLSKSRYDSEYTNIVEGKTGFPLYLNPKSSIDKSSELYKHVFKEKDHIGEWENPEFFLDNNLDRFAKYYKKYSKFNFYEKYKSSYSFLLETFEEYARKKGYAKDRWLRTMLKDGDSNSAIDSWAIYDDNGDPVVDKNITITKPVFDQDGKISFQKLQGLDQNRAQAYWWWLLESYGVGNRTITGLWRIPSKDALAIWGYLPTDLANKVKYIKATNGKSIKYIPVHTKGTNNLFYFKKQGDISSKHVLADDGFSSWAVDLLTIGTWHNATLGDGEWLLEFVDKNKNDVIDPSTNINAFTLGDIKKPGGVKMLTENNKDASYAPLRVEDREGKVVLVARSEFSN